MDARFGGAAMNAATFDPDEIIREVRAAANLSPIATIATLRQPEPKCRNVASVARDDASKAGANRRKVASVASPSSRGEGTDTLRLAGSPRGGVSSDCFAELMEERSAIAEYDGKAPRVYCDAWARLQCEPPKCASETEWLRALDDAGRFLDSWGSIAAELDWPAKAIFAVPREKESGGLVWILRGATVRSLATRHAHLSDGRIFTRPSTEQIDRGASEILRSTS